MYTLTVFTVLVAQALGGYVGEHAAYHGPEAKPVVRPDGFLADTHDVAAAKNLHLSALSAASHSGGDSNDHGDSHGHGDDSHNKYHGPHAVPKVLADGHLADTHEVSAAKQAHLAALASAKSHNHGSSYETGHETSHHDSHHDSHHEAYHGPLAKPVVLPSGHLADTHEVAAAKGAHLDAVAHAGH